MANEAISQAPDAGAYNPLWRFPVAIPGNTAPASTSAGIILGPLNLISTGITTNQQLGSGPLPANGFLLRLLARNLTNAPVSASIGTTLGGSDVISTFQIPAAGANTGTLTLPYIGDPNWFSATQPQNLYITVGTVGASGINVQLDFEVGP